MEIRNRMADVIRLRCNACQDFLKMILCDNWQEKLYSISKKTVEANSSYSEKYKDAYGKMREVGYNNYSVDKMDVTFIYVIVNYCDSIVKPLDKSTRKALKDIKDDRNIKGHSSENEPSEELYQQSFLALCNLEDFIKAVDCEKAIDDESRLLYRQKYSEKIKKLKSLIDDERITFIQRNKEIENDIKEIISSKNPDQRWCEIYKKYWTDWKSTNGFNRILEFSINASDAGIRNAHIPAANAFIYKKNYEEAEHRLTKMTDAYNNLAYDEVKDIIGLVNKLYEFNNQKTSGIKQIINKITNQGYSVEETEKGYVLKKTSKA